VQCCSRKRIYLNKCYFNLQDHAVPGTTVIAIAGCAAWLARRTLRGLFRRRYSCVTTVLEMPYMKVVWKMEKVSCPPRAFIMLSIAANQQLQPLTGNLFCSRQLGGGWRLLKKPWTTEKSGLRFAGFGTAGVRLKTC
jgi:hypothetical protein